MFYFRIPIYFMNCSIEQILCIKINSWQLVEENPVQALEESPVQAFQIYFTVIKSASLSLLASFRFYWTVWKHIKNSPPFQRTHHWCTSHRSLNLCPANRSSSTWRSTISTFLTSIIALRRRKKRAESVVLSKGGCGAEANRFFPIYQNTLSFINHFFF